MSGLILMRRAGESIKIGSDITITVVKISGRQCQVAIVAPPQINIVRTELIDKPERRDDGGFV